MVEKKDAIAIMPRNAAEARAGYQPPEATVLTRKIRRAMGMRREFVRAGGKAGWIPNRGSRALAAAERNKITDGN